MGLIITLILAGIILILAEIFLIPGIGIAGVLGVLSLCGSCWYAFAYMSPLTGAVVTIVNVALHIKDFPFGFVQHIVDETLACDCLARERLLRLLLRYFRVVYRLSWHAVYHLQRHGRLRLVCHVHPTEASRHKRSIEGFNFFYGLPAE